MSLASKNRFLKRMGRCRELATVKFTRGQYLGMRFKGILTDFLVRAAQALGGSP